MAGVWTRNYYNVLTGLALTDHASISNAQPTTYDPPIRVHFADNTYDTVSGETPSRMQVANSNISKLVANGLLTPFPLGKGNMTYVTSYGDSFYTYYATGVQFGSGSTPATYEDYKTESPLTSGLSVADTNGTLVTPSTLDNTHLKSRRTYTVTNSGATTLTINEICLFANYPRVYGTGACWVLLYREVLDTPIMLAQGESIIIGFNRDAEIYNYTPY